LRGTLAGLQNKKQQIMQIWKYSGKLFLYTGILHTILGIVLGKDAFTEIIRRGFINSVDGEPAIEYPFWFLICGILIILFGMVLDHYIRQTRKPAPASLGWSLFVISIIGCLIMPLSGFWLFLPQAFIIIMANQKRNSR